jgi:hypothetical protein
VSPAISQPLATGSAASSGSESRSNTKPATHQVGDLGEEPVDTVPQRGVVVGEVGLAAEHHPIVLDREHCQTRVVLEDVGGGGGGQLEELGARERPGGLRHRGEAEARRVPVLVSSHSRSIKSRFNRSHGPPTTKHRAFQL